MVRRVAGRIAELGPTGVLLPHPAFINGYRNKDTLEAVRSVFYQEVLQDAALEPEQFYITLPLKDVKIAGTFYDDVYNTYFVESEKAEDPD
jgi:hypothetical protein